MCPALMSLEMPDMPTFVHPDGHPVDGRVSPCSKVLSQNFFLNTGRHVSNTIEQRLTKKN